MTGLAPAHPAPAHAAPEHADTGTSGAVRPARPGDVPALVRMVRELAAYEREPDAVRLTEGVLQERLFGADPAVFAHVAVREAGDEPGSPSGDGTVVGMAVWFLTFSTWTGTHGIWLEDLYVRPEARGAGLGRALLATLAAACVQRGFARLEWSVLDWNAPAVGFYRSVGAVGMEDWTTQRLHGDALIALATAAATGRANGARSGPGRSG